MLSLAFMVHSCVRILLRFHSILHCRLRLLPGGFVMLEAAWSSLSLHAFELAFRHALAQSVALSWLRAVHRPLLPPCGFAGFCSRLRSQDLSCLERLGCGFSSMRRAVYVGLLGIGTGCSFGNSSCTSLLSSMASLGHGHVYFSL